jgi:glutamine synthetase adenylyltransferase
MSSIVLPIYKSALELAVYMEQIVRGFEKYHKYTMGVELRQKSKTLLFAVGHVNLSDNKVHALTQLRDAGEEMKMLIQLCKELRVFKNFRQFEHSSFLAVAVCKQAQAWLVATKRDRGKCATR